MKAPFFSLSLLLVLFYLSSCSSSSNTGAATKREANAIPEVKAVFINGDSLHYIEKGKGDPVIFIHGTVGDYRVWEQQMDTFALGHRVIAYSRRFAYPNNQTVNDSAEYTVTPHSKDLTEFIKALNLGPVHLVGHSYGAFTALLTTMDHPQLVRSLTLGEPPVMSLLENVQGGDTILNKFLSNAIIPAAALFKNKEDEKAVSVFINGVMGDSLYYGNIPKNMRDIMMVNLTELKGAVNTRDLFPPVSCDDLRKIKTPVLLVQGDRSPLLFTSIISELDRCLSNKEKVTLMNTSHGLEYENPVAFNKLVLEFVNKH